MKKLIALAALLGLSACAPSGMFESEPVNVPTTKGVVTCQLYTEDVVWWDTSIARPRNMPQQEADDICYNIGLEMSRKNN